MIVTLHKLLQKSKQVADPRDAHALALDLVESMLRHYAVVAIAAYRHAGARDAKVNRILSEQLPRPSMGSWKNFLQMLAAADKELSPEQFREKFLSPLTKKISLPDISTAHAGLRRLADQDVFSSHETPAQSEPIPCTPLEFFDATVAYRNRFAGHGTHELPDSALRFAPLFLKGTAALCTHLAALWLACPVYVAKQAKLYGRTFFRLTPLVEAEGISEIQAAVPGMEEDRLYICFGDRKHPEVESLYPAALWEEDDILFANGTKGLIDIYYIGYVSQRSFETSIYEEDFRAFIGPFAPPRDSGETKLPVAPIPLAPVLLPQAKRKHKLVLASLGLVLLLIVTIAGFWQFVRERGTVSKVEEKQEIKSIAVLPFEDMSPERNQEWFCNGMADAVIYAIAPIKGLTVKSPNSSFQYKGKYSDFREIGKALGVDTVMKGGVLKQGNLLRITTQLINAGDNSQYFSRQYNGDIEDVFAILDSVSLAIAGELRGMIADAEKSVLTQRSTDNREAFELYLRGRNYEYGEKITRGQREEALPYYQQAVEKDPRFALAHAAIAHIYNINGYVNYYGDEQAFEKAKKETQIALKIDDYLAGAHAELAWTSMYYDWDWDTAEKAIKRALELNPNLFWVQWYYRDYCMIMRDWDKAIAAIKRANEIDPQHDVKLYIWLTLWWAGRLEEANKIIKEISAERKEDPVTINIGLAVAAAERGDIQEIYSLIPELIKMESYNDTYILGKLAYIYNRIGKREKAEKLLSKMLQIPLTRSYRSDISMVYGVLGEYDKAFFWLEKSIENHEPEVVFFACEPRWKPLREQPKGKEILKRLRLDR